MGVAISRDDDVLAIDYPDCLREDFPRQVQPAVDAVECVIHTLTGRSFETLARRSPGLIGFDWRNYLSCSIARMVHAAAALERRGVTNGVLLDCGSYFGNYSLMFRQAGFTADALDAYRSYGEALALSVGLLAGNGVRIVDFEDAGYDLAGLPAGRYDVVFCGSVIEHVPHTPRLLLEGIDRVLKPGGLLLMDTPNLAYLYNRQKLARGESVMPEIRTQFYTDVPFQGHHHEYTVSEMVWMLNQIGHVDISVELFNYSEYGCQELRGRDVDNHWAMTADPTLRELIMTVSRKPLNGRVASGEIHWRAVYEEPEQVWRRRLATSGRPAGAEANLELTRVRLQEEVNLRDRLLAEQEARLQREIQLRDELLAATQVRHVTLRDVVRRGIAFMTRGWRRWVNR